jgi:hypothetical protein
VLTRMLAKRRKKRRNESKEAQLEMAFAFLWLS